MYQAYNLTNREAYRLGCLSQESIEALIDREESIEAVDGVTHQISEALGCYPGEDFLVELIDSLQVLRNGLRGANREHCQRIIEQAEDLQQCVFNEGDYGRSELREARKALEDAGL